MRVLDAARRSREVAERRYTKFAELHSALTRLGCAAADAQPFPPKVLFQVAAWPHSIRLINRSIAVPVLA